MPGESDRTKWRGIRPIHGIRGIWPALDSVRVTDSGSQTGSGTNDIYTVPSGKILFISNAQLTTRQTATANTAGYISVKNDSDVHQYHFCYLLHSIASAFNMSAEFRPALEAGAGWDVYVGSNNAALAVVGAFFGWLEDA